MLTKNVLGAEERDHLISDLRKKPFSLIVDESTDLGCTKSLAGVVRYVDEKMRTFDQFLFLKEVDDASSDGIFKIITGKYSFLNMNI